MKQFNQKNQIWFEQNDGVVRVGFTKSFLDQLDQCWHIVPANQQRFREKSPLMVIETNDALVSIMSPVAANFVEWNRKAQDFPDQLKEDDVILTMTTNRVQAQPRDMAIMDELANVAADQAWVPPQIANRAFAPQGQPVRRGARTHEEVMRQIREQQELMRINAVQPGEF